MASIWLEPILHEEPGYYSEPIKLRKALEIHEIRISKPQALVSQIEFWARDLKKPSNELCMLEKTDSLEEGKDYIMRLETSILTNYLVVKGNYKDLSICLEATPVAFHWGSLMPVDEDIDLLVSFPLKYPGLFRYWMDSEDSPKLCSKRYQSSKFPGPSWTSPLPPPSLPIDLQDLLAQIQAAASQAEYYQLLESLRKTISFQELAEESPYIFPVPSFGIELEPLVQVTVRALNGNSDGICEARYGVDLVAPLLRLQMQSSFFQTSALQNLLLLLTHPDGRSTLQLQVLKALETLLLPCYASELFELDCMHSLSSATLEHHFAFSPRENLKKKKSEEVAPKTVYQVLLSQLRVKRTTIVRGAILRMVNKAAFIQQLRSFSTSGQHLDLVRKNLKSHLLHSSSSAFNSLKSELQASLLLDLDALNKIQGLAKLVGGLSLPRWLGAWLSHTKLLRNLALALIDDKIGRTAERYRQQFLKVADILLTLLRSCGGLSLFTEHKPHVQALCEILEAVQAPGDEPAEYSLIEEEYLLSIVQPEKLQAYASQLGFLLRSFVKLGEMLSTEDPVPDVLSEVYGWVCAEDSKFPGIAWDVLYCYVKTHPQVFLGMAERLDSMVGIFYFVELVTGLLELDRSAELVLQAGPALITAIERLETQLPEQQEALQIVKDWLAPLKNVDVAHLVLAVNTAAHITPHRYFRARGVTLLGRDTGSLDEFGSTAEAGSAMIQVLSSIRLLNALVSINKWLSIDLIKCGGLHMLTELISHFAYFLHSMVIRFYEDAVFEMPHKSTRTKDAIEVLLAALNIVNILLQQFVSTNLLSYNNAPLLEATVHIVALAEHLPERARALQKLVRMVRTTFTLWAQQPNFVDVFLPLIFQHSFQNPFKREGVLNLISSIFEHYVSYKHPGLLKALHWLSCSPAPNLFKPELLYFYLMRASKIEDEQSILRTFFLSMDQVLEHKSSKYFPRQNWNFKKLPSLNVKADMSVLGSLVFTFATSNCKDIHQSVVRILRCVGAAHHRSGIEILCKAAIELLKYKKNTRKALLLISSLIDLPAIRLVFNRENLIETLTLLFQDEELGVQALQITSKLLSLDFGLSEDVLYRIAEELPSLQQLSGFILECRKLFTFEVPGFFTSKSFTIEDDEEDDIYKDFQSPAVLTTTCHWSITSAALECLAELSSHEVGRSLVLCGQFPYSEILSHPLNFEDLAKRIYAGLDDPELSEGMIEMLRALNKIIKNTGQALPSETVSLLNERLSERDSKITIELQSMNIDHRAIELPEPRELDILLSSGNLDFPRVEEFYKTSQRNHMVQLVEGKRLGEKLQLKAIQALTDLQPPPYPAMFKFKGEVSTEFWEGVLDSNRGFIPELIQERARQADEANKVSQPQQSEIYSEMYQPTPAIHPAVMSAVMPRQVYPTMTIFTGPEQMAMQELFSLLDRSDKSQDPRVKARIEHILTSYPSLYTLISSKTDSF